MTNAVVNAIVLTGGRARRLGGVDKGAVEVGGATLLAHTLAAVRKAKCSQVVVVGPAAEVPASVTVVREDPPFSGPVAGIACGVRELSTESAFVYVLACDMPRVHEALAVLRDAVQDNSDGVIAVDRDGFRQPLLALYRTQALAAALAALDDPRDVPVRDLIKDLRLETVSVGRAAADADTWNDVRQLNKEFR